MGTSQDGPITIVGLLWFKPDGGEAAYRKYLEAAKPFMEKHFGRPFTSQGYELIGSRGGDLDPDLVAINEFPSEAAFMEATQDPDYPAELLRDAVTRVEVLQLRKE